MSVKNTTVARAFKLTVPTFQAVYNNLCGNIETNLNGAVRCYSRFILLRVNRIVPVMASDWAAGYCEVKDKGHSDGNIDKRSSAVKSGGIS